MADAQAWLCYLESLGQPGPVARTAYRRDLDQLAAFLAPLPLQEAGSEHLRSFVAHLGRSGLAGTTLRRKLTGVRAFYRFLLRSGAIALDPTLGLVVTGSESSAKAALSPAQIAQLLAMPSAMTAAGLRDRILLLACYAGGLSIQQVTASDLAHLDFDRCLWRLCDRELPLDPPLRAGLWAYVQQGRSRLLAGKTCPALFVSVRGERMSGRAIQQRLAHWGVSAQQLRNSYAAHLLATGADPAVVQQLLGLRSAAATQAHRQEPPARLRRIFELAHPRR